MGLFKKKKKRTSTPTKSSTTYGSPSSGRSTTSYRDHVTPTWDSHTTYDYGSSSSHSSSHDCGSSSHSSDSGSCGGGGD